MVPSNNNISFNVKSVTEIRSLIWGYNMVWTTPMARKPIKHGIILTYSHCLVIRRANLHGCTSSHFSTFFTVGPLHCMKKVEDVATVALLRALCTNFWLTLMLISPGVPHRRDWFQTSLQLANLISAQLVPITHLMPSGENSSDVLSAFLREWIINRAKTRRGVLAFSEWLIHKLLNMFWKHMRPV